MRKSLAKRWLPRCRWLLPVMLCVAACKPPAGYVHSPQLQADVAVFRFWAPAARVVQLSGSWQSNFHLRGRDWNSDRRVGQMQRISDEGVWQLEVPLGPGRYDYLFLVDGRFWELDPANPQRRRDTQFGTVSVLVVP